jgi:hypothetical protein
VARKIKGLQRVLDAPALFSVAYGEIASSIYIALGIIALHALGLSPEVLAIVGALFLVVTLSYAEGTTSIPETGGAATFVRRAFNDLAGFLTGWAIFLDYLIVIALSALFLPHYLGAAMQWGSLEHNPWDVVVGVFVVLGVAAVRLVRRSAFYRYGIFVAVLDLLTQCCSSCSASPSSSRSTPSRRASRSARIRPGTRSRSRCRWRCSPIPAWRRSRTWPRRRASPVATSRAASSRGSAWSC